MSNEPINRHHEGIQMYITIKKTDEHSEEERIFIPFSSSIQKSMYC